MNLRRPTIEPAEDLELEGEAPRPWTRRDWLLGLAATAPFAVLLTWLFTPGSGAVRKFRSDRRWPHRRARARP